MQEDLRHTNELGDLQDTSYWVKRDLKTFQKAFWSTIKYAPFLLLATLILATLTQYAYQFLSLGAIIRTTVVYYPIILLLYFLLYVMVNKGYNISKTGTTVDESRSENESHKT